MHCALGKTKEKLREGTKCKYYRLLIITIGGSGCFAILAIIVWKSVNQHEANTSSEIPSTNVTGIPGQVAHLETVGKDVILTGDPSVLNHFFNKGYDDQLTLHKSQNPLIDERCSNEITNNYGIYCPDLDLFCTRSQNVQNGTFNYFSDWSENPSSNYEISSGGKIQVKSSGKYEIHAEVQWKTENDILMRLFKVNTLGIASIINDECKQLRDPEKKEPTEMKCTISNVTSLLKNEVVYLGFKPNSPFFVRRGTPSFHVTKVDSIF